MKRFPAVLLMGLMATGGCAVSSRVGSSDVAAIDAASREFSAAYVRGDVDAMMAIYTPDAVIFPNSSEAIQGSEDIRRYWALPPGQTVMHHRATPTEIRVDGDHAYDHGVYEISGTRDGTPWGPDHGKNVIVWRRTPQGWRMHLDMWNSRPRG
jgi:ketosteroid isomerase-like protein